MQSRNGAPIRKASGFDGEEIANKKARRKRGNSGETDHWYEEYTEVTGKPLKRSVQISR